LDINAHSIDNHEVTSSDVVWWWIQEFFAGDFRFSISSPTPSKHLVSRIDLSVLQLLSTSPSNTSSTSTRFGLSDCKGKIPRRWSLRPGRYPQDADQVCWPGTASSRWIWRKGGELPLNCLHWTSSATESLGGKNSATLGFIGLPRQYGCLVPDVHTDMQQARMQNAECSRDEPNQVTSSLAGLLDITVYGRVP